VVAVEPEPEPVLAAAERAQDLQVWAAFLFRACYPADFGRGQASEPDS